MPGLCPFNCNITDQDQCYMFNPNSNQCVLFDIRDAIQSISLSQSPHQNPLPEIVFDHHINYLNEIENEKNSIHRGIVRAAIINTGHVANRCTLDSSFVSGDQIIRLITFDSPDIIKNITEAIENTCLECFLSYRFGGIAYSKS